MLRQLVGASLRAARPEAWESRALSGSAATCQRADTSAYDWFFAVPEWWSHQKPAAERYCRQRKVIALGNRVPWLASDVYIAPSAVVIGDVDAFDGVRAAPAGSAPGGGG